MNVMSNIKLFYNGLLALFLIMPYNMIADGFSDPTVDNDQVFGFTWFKNGISLNDKQSKGTFD